MLIKYMATIMFMIDLVTEAQYHNQGSKKLISAVMTFLGDEVPIYSIFAVR